MRINSPVTGVERIMRDGEFIVSKTDLKGVITYINPYFTEISDFTEADVVGQSHNIVRHPDMPMEAFKDFWETLKAGKPWTGYVKNRTKTGDHYWVVANATPIWENGGITGYLSVRSKPDRQAVAQIERIYADFRSGKAKGLAIKEGQVVATSTPAKLLATWRHMKIATRLWLNGALLISAMAVIGGMGYYGEQHAADQMKTLEADRVVPLRQLKIIADAYAVDVIDAANKTNAGLFTAEQALVAVKGAQEKIRTQWTAYRATTLTEKEAALAEEAEALFVPADAAVAALQQRLASLSGNVKGGLSDFDGPLYPAIDAIGGKITELFDLQLAVVHDIAVETEASSKNFASLIAMIAVAAVLLGGFLIQQVNRIIVSPISTISDLMRLIAEGKFDIAITKERDDEFGNLVDAFRSLYIRLGFDLAESREQLKRAIILRTALDSVSTGVMVANNDRVITYVNPAATRLMKNAEKDIQASLADFSADNLLGTCIDGFHKNPAHQAGLLAKLQGTYRSALTIGPRHMTVVAAPIMDEKGNRFGSVVEWKDRTIEVAIEREVADIVSAASAGEFSARLKTEDKEGFFKQLAEGLNMLLETSEAGMTDIQVVLQALAKGDLTKQIDKDYRGLFGEMKNAANETSSQLNEIVLRIRESTDTINTAANEIAAGNTDLSSRTEEQASSLEETASSMEELTSTVKQNADNAKQANQLAVTASDIAQKGGAVVHEVVGTMGAIHDSARKIVDIISVIDGIAFQTNILALNAAVEAARAGEQGRGFAVVAGEVRSLAQRSAGAAKEIKTLISDSVEKVENGNKLVSQAGDTMKEVVTAIRRVTDLMSEIAAASQEQSRGIEQVGAAITQMDEVTQQNAALVEEAAAAAESLEDQSRQLVEAVRYFDTGSSGGSTAAIATAKRAPGKPAPRISKPAPRLERGKPKPAPTDPDDEWEQF